MSDRDAEAFDHYDEPARREPAGAAGQRPRERSLTRHVPVRFPTSTVDAVRELAEADGMSVSAWIRHTVDQEIVRRNGPQLVDKGLADPRVVVERLRRDLDDLAAALEPRSLAAASRAELARPSTQQ
jgi:hypothetical protein